MSEHDEPQRSEPTPPDSDRNGNLPKKPEADPRELLKRDLDTYRLPADVKAQLLAEMPPIEEQEKLYREHMENGGHSFEELQDALEPDGEPQP